MPLCLDALFFYLEFERIATVAGRRAMEKASYLSKCEIGTTLFASQEVHQSNAQLDAYMSSATQLWGP